MKEDAKPTLKTIKMVDILNAFVHLLQKKLVWGVGLAPSTLGTQTFNTSKIATESLAIFLLLQVRPPISTVVNLHLGSSETQKEESP